MAKGGFQPEIRKQSHFAFDAEQGSALISDPPGCRRPAHAGRVGLRM
jgi:hypothetical protein